MHKIHLTELYNKMGALYSILQGEKPQSNENNIIIFFKQQRVMIKD